MRALDASGLFKSFEGRQAVAGVGLTLDAGEVRGLLGPNGAGKTTLLRMLFGLIAPDAGSIALLGRPLAELARDGLDGVGGFVEDPRFYPYLSARANLRLLAKLDGGAADSGEVESVLERVGLRPRANDRVSGFSTGMRQRLGLAAALLRQPRLLLLDEPTSGLDPAGARAVAALVRELARNGVAVLLSSHHIGELERVCDSYTIMREGRVLWEGAADDVEGAAPGSAHALQTSDDARALELAAAAPGVRAEPDENGYISVTARSAALDALVLTLGEERVVIRRLELLVSPLESLFFCVTGEAEPAQTRDPDSASPDAIPA